MQAGITSSELRRRTSAVRSKMQSSLTEASGRKAERRRAEQLQELKTKAKAYNITAGQKLGTQLSMTDAELEAEVAKMDEGTQVRVVGSSWTSYGCGIYCSRLQWQLRYRRATRFEADRLLRARQEEAYTTSLQQDQLKVGTPYLAIMVTHAYCLVCCLVLYSAYS